LINLFLHRSGSNKLIALQEDCKYVSGPIETEMLLTLMEKRMSRNWKYMVQPVCLTAFLALPAYSASGKFSFFDNAGQFAVFDPYGVVNELENPDAMVDEEAPGVVSFIDHARDSLDIEI